MLNVNTQYRHFIHYSDFCGIANQDFVYEPSEKLSRFITWHSW